MSCIFVVSAVLAVAFAGPVEKRSIVDCASIRCEEPTCENPIYNDAHCCGLCPSRNPNLSKCALVLCPVVQPVCDDPFFNDDQCCGKCAKPVCRFGTNNQFCGGYGGIPCEDPSTECVVKSDIPDAGGICCYKSRPRPRQCPEPDGFGICVELCASDLECGVGEKCCSNGCGHVCTKD